VGALKFHTFLTSPDLTKVPGLLDLTARAAVTDDAHEELPEAIDNPLTGPSAREGLPSRVTCVITHRRDRRWDCTAGLICTPTITC
jgi:hypothetical protein